MPLPSKPLPAITMGDRYRFWAKVAVTEGCWEWRAGRFRNGYGKFRLGNRQVTAHRFMWVDTHGEPRQGLVIDHICENRTCVRPDHLQLLTNAQNIRRTTDRITRCPQGHEKTPESTRINANGYRICIPCVREQGRKHDAKRRPRKR